MHRKVVVGDKGRACGLSTKNIPQPLNAGPCCARAAQAIEPRRPSLYTNEYQGRGRLSAGAPGMEHTTEGGCCLAKGSPGRPVKVVWTREEDQRVQQHQSHRVFPGAAGPHGASAADGDARCLRKQNRLLTGVVGKRLFPWF